MSEIENFDAFLQLIRDGDPYLIEHEKHPSDKLLNKFVSNKLNQEDHKIVAAHVATCSPCAKRTIDLRRYLAEIEAEKLKQDVLKLVSEFVKRHYPNEISFLTDVWPLMKNRTLNEISEFARKSVSSPAGMLAFGETTRNVGTHAIITLSCVAYLTNELNTADTSKFRTQETQKALMRILKSLKADNQLSKQLIEFLV